MADPCPVDGCTYTVKRHHLMCPPHWYSLSPATRHEVWDAYKERPRSERHIAAVLAAVDEANAKAAA